jgi:hypothetical protein
MISANRYKIIADLINNAQDRGNDIVGYFDNMSDTLSESEMVEGSTDRQRLQDQIDATSEIMVSYHQLYPPCMKNFVFPLQKYIDDNYSSVNDFLSDNNIKVLPVFADISEVVGYPIDAANIDDIS